jgi:chaperonin GroEL
VALINAMSSVDKLEMDSDDAKIGVGIVRRALELPLRKIAENAGKDGSVILEGVRRQHEAQKNNRIGYNVLTEEYIDMVDDGVIDPAKVTRGALENATSIAAMILTTEALITDIPEETPPPAPPMPDY